MFKFYIDDTTPHGTGSYVEEPTRDFFAFEKLLKNDETGEIIRTNESWDSALANIAIQDQKNNAPHEQKIDVAHDNYLYSYARTNGPLGYKSLGEQMDMQFWDNTNGTTTWADHIQSVKTAYPKPS